MIGPKSLRVLLVEDNELDARTMTKRLAAHGDTNFRITRAADLASAKKLLGAPEGDESFDCILLDLSLPDSVGLVSVEVLSSAAPDCPIVVLTGLDDPSIALEAVEQGAQDYLSKQNSDPEIVARSIRYAVARNHSDLALRSATDQLGLLHDRERIARDLHDTVIQQLFATGIGLQSGLASVTDSELHGRMLGTIEGIDAAIRQLREAIFGLHAVPQHVALAASVSELADEKAAALGFQPMVNVGTLPEDLAPALSHEAVQVVGEALTNIAKHANATAAKIDVTADQGWLRLTVSDNGEAMSARPTGDQSNDLTGRGLANMRDRAANLGGSFHFGPGSGGGTRIEWAAPLTAENR